MDDLEAKLNSVLQDPDMMQKLMTMARSLGSQPSTKNEPAAKPQDILPDIDLGMLQKLSGFARQGSIDKDQQTLLRALGPYLSRDRITKLEKAMRAAKMARMATGLLGSSGL